MYDEVRSTFTRDDEAVSPVIAVILMVAITVVLAATVYVWVSGFASDDTGPEQASATAKGVDLDDSGDVEWAKITLTKGNNAPYDNADITISIADPHGKNVTDAPYTSAQNSSSAALGNGDSWDVGENLWVPCTNSASGGNLILGASVKGTAILDTTISCEQNA